METKYCVQIRVPLVNEEEEGFGSCYTLGPHWILTACHVLFPANRDDSKPIKIIWLDETT
jgi:hypothetical protein